MSSRLCVDGQRVNFENMAYKKNRRKTRKQRTRREDIPTQPTKEKTNSHLQDEDSDPQDAMRKTISHDVNDRDVLPKDDHFEIIQVYAGCAGYEGEAEKLTDGDRRIKNHDLTHMSSSS